MRIINYQIHSVTLASHVSTHLLIYLSAQLCHHHSHTIHHSFTLSLQASLKAYLFNKSLILFLPLHCFHARIVGPDRTYHASGFIFSSFFFL